MSQRSSAGVEQRRRLGRVNALLARFVATGSLGEDELRSALVTAAVACLFLAIAPIYALLAWLIERPPPLMYGVALMAFATATSGIVLLRLGRPRVGAWVLLAGGTTCVFITFWREGPASQAAGNFTIVIVMAALLVGWRGVLGLGAAIVALLLGSELASRRGLFHPVESLSTGGVFALMQASSLTVMLIVFDRVRLELVRHRLELEARLLQAQRLEAVGRLAGGVAHDFNNILTVVLGNVSLLADRKGEPESFELDQIRRAAERAADLTRQLLAFSKQQRLAPRTLDLVALLRTERAMIERLIPEHIQISVSAPTDPLFIHADPGQISQVFLNLAVNARDAMADGGRLDFVLRRATSDELTKLPSLPRREAEPGVELTGAYVFLSVGDTGRGMDAETQARAFEPFFTTKDSGGGTGLGLATVHGVVSQTGGVVQVESAVGVGTVFSIYLPEVRSPQTRSDAPGREVASVRRARVLLVEDEPAVRRATAEVLRLLGHTVTECESPNAALETVARTPDAFDLVVSDVILAGGTGPELVEKLLALGPRRVLFVSGFLHDSLEHPLLRRAPFLPKPFNRRALAEKIEEVLAAPPLVAAPRP